MFQHIMEESYRKIKFKGPILLLKISSFFQKFMSESFEGGWGYSVCLRKGRKHQKAYNFTWIIVDGRDMFHVWRHVAIHFQVAPAKTRIKRAEHF